MLVLILSSIGFTLIFAGISMKRATKKSTDTMMMRHYTAYKDSVKKNGSTSKL